MSVFHTVQPPDFWAECRTKGVICPDPTKLEYGQYPEFLFAYDWMRNRMRERIPNFTGHYPVWAYVEKPDLRRSGFGKKGQREVLLTLDVPDERVVLTDMDDWHYALNQWYLHLDDKDNSDDAMIDKYWDAPLTEKVQSWNHMFHPDRKRANEPYYQACIDRVYVHEVRSARHFTAR